MIEKPSKETIRSIWKDLTSSPKKTGKPKKETIRSCDFLVFKRPYEERRCGHRAKVKSSSGHWCVKHGLVTYGFTNRVCNRRVMLANYGIDSYGDAGVKFFTFKKKDKPEDQGESM